MAAYVPLKTHRSRPAAPDPDSPLDLRLKDLAVRYEDARAKAAKAPREDWASYEHVRRIVGLELAGMIRQRGSAFSHGGWTYSFVVYGRVLELTRNRTPNWGKRRAPRDGDDDA